MVLNEKHYTKVLKILAQKKTMFFNQKKRLSNIALKNIRHSKLFFLKRLIIFSYSEKHDQ